MSSVEDKEVEEEVKVEEEEEVEEEEKEEERCCTGELTAGE